MTRTNALGQASCDTSRKIAHDTSIDLSKGDKKSTLMQIMGQIYFKKGHPWQMNLAMTMIN